MSEENNMAEFQQEGINPFEESGDDTSSESPAENNEEDEDPDGQGNEDDDQDGQDDDGDGDGQKPNQEPKNDDVPFHKHPRWIQREREWDKKFNDQEERHKKDMEDIKNSIHPQKLDQTEEIPQWFGGDENQWKGFVQWFNQRSKGVGDSVLSTINEAKTSETKAINEATKFMEDEISIIESDKTLNPNGIKVDPNKLLKTVMDNDLVDSNGRWNYRAGWRLMQGQPKPAKPDVNKKKIAAATTANSNAGDGKKRAFRTAEDFKTDRPW